MAPAQEIKKEVAEEEPIRKKQAISSDDLYRRSSQYEFWSFTAESLQELRQKTNQHGRDKSEQLFNHALESSKQKSPEVFEKYPLELCAESLLDYVSCEEETKYLNFYSQNVIKISNFFKMPTQVKASAISFFKKFYLMNSVMEYHPKNVLYTCIFLAAKSENYFISIESFVKVLKNTTPKDILDLEFNVLQSLKFTLLVHHPFRPLYGFFLDYQAVLLHPSPLMYDVTVDTLGSLYDKAKKWLNDHALLSDIMFLFSPPQVALAAMYDIDKRITDKYLKRKFLHDNHEKMDTIKEEVKVKVEKVKLEEDDSLQDEKPEPKSEYTIQREQYETMVRTIRKCIKIAKQLPQATLEESKEIDRKCFFALNPGRKIEKRKTKLMNPSQPAEVKEEQL